MEKSIELIWKEGFLNTQELIAPKVTNLYNQKSVHIIEKLKRMLRANHVFLFIVAFGATTTAFMMAGIYLAIPVLALHIPLLFLSAKYLKSMEQVDQSANSYQYLKSFNDWLKGVIKELTKYIRYYYATLFVLMMIGLWVSKSEPLLRKFPDTLLVNGIPVYWTIGVLFVAGLMVFFGKRIYEFDLYLVYGKSFQKLEEILADMEELRGQTK